MFFTYKRSVLLTNSLLISLNAQYIASYLRTMLDNKKTDSIAGVCFEHRYLRFYSS